VNTIKELFWLRKVVRIQSFMNWCVYHKKAMLFVPSSLSKCE